MENQYVGEGEVVDKIDEIVPLKECNEKRDIFSENYRIYCPDFNDNHFIYGDYSTTQYSWLKLAIHYCDPSLRTCEEKEEIDTFL